VLGYCDIRCDMPNLAIASIQKAISLDPGNWNFRYDLAVMRASAGLDPIPAARTALALDSREPLVQNALDTPCLPRSRSDQHYPRRSSAQAHIQRGGRELESKLPHTIAAVPHGRGDPLGQRPSRGSRADRLRGQRAQAPTYSRSRGRETYLQLLSGNASYSR
jgi:hypothetical protein